MSTIFIFRRDLRLYDNLGLDYAMKNFKNVIPIFIFTPEQITKKNKFKSENAIQFMIESLKNLDKKLKKHKSKLHIFYGENKKVINNICENIDVENIVTNKDYTPYAIKRDDDLSKLCKSRNINFYNPEDYLLLPVGTIKKKDESIYTVFTPFRNKGFKFTIEKPLKKYIKNLSKLSKSEIKNLNFYSDYPKHNINSNLIVKGDRKIATKVLKNLKKFNNYNEDRNQLSLRSTLLSAYIKFGLVSIREVYWCFRDNLGTDNSLISQLFWREFYYYIAYYFPFVLKGDNYNSKYDNLKWNNDTKLFDKWCLGETGYPVVDAGMRELNKTGYMHNRARLITSNFMNRMLGLDWRLGEKYYASKLTDYDPSVNNGNWQWIASTGVDPKPYFQRLFNPWIQSKKFDKDANYIKKWIPELKNIPSKELHQWDKYCDNYDLKKINYYEPVVNYKNARKKSIDMYRQVL